MGVRTWVIAVVGAVLAWGRVAQGATGATGLPAMADPNGQELTFERLDVRVAAHGPLTLTELDMVFRNPKDRQVEGRFSCDLPAGAVVSRFAKEVDGRLMEGEVVERLRATQIYTQILHQMRDPALLEQEQGNRFSARVFPIEAGAPVRLLLSYSRVVPAGEDGRRVVEQPLKGLPRLGTFTLRVVCRPLPGEDVSLNQGWFGLPRRTDGDVVIFEESAERRDFVPPYDLQVAFAPRADAPRSYRVRAGGFELHVRRPGAAVAGDEPPPAEWLVAVDTSASAARQGAHRFEALALVLDALELSCPDARFTLEAFDLAAAAAGAWTGRERGARPALQALRARGCMGATNLERELGRLGAWLREGPGRRALLVCDGIPTMGGRDAAALTAALGTVPEGARLHVLVVGSPYDETLTGAVAEAGRGRVVTVPLTQRFKEGAAEAAARLRRAPGPTVLVPADGCEWVWPGTFRDVQGASEVVAFAKLASGAVSGADALSAESFAPLLEREAWHAYLGLLERREALLEDPEQRRAVRAERLGVSVKQRVLCPLTALLVLETEEDYQRFGLDRRALADVMVVGARGIEWLKRAPGALPAAAATPTASPTARPVPTPAATPTGTPPPAKAGEDREDRAEGADKPAFPAGRDPLIRVADDPGLRSVVAVFPWGETKVFVRDQALGLWLCRFIVPPAWPDGDYEVVVVVTRLDGTRARLVFAFRADRLPPSAGGRGRAARSEGGWRVTVAVEASADAWRVEAFVPGGSALPLAQDPTSGRFEGAFDWPADGGRSVTVPVMVFDRCHNRLMFELEVELK